MTPGKPPLQFGIANGGDWFSHGAAIAVTGPLACRGNSLQGR